MPADMKNTLGLNAAAAVNRTIDQPDDSIGLTITSSATTSSSYAVDLRSTTGCTLFRAALSTSNNYVNIGRDDSNGSSFFYRNLTAASTSGPVVKIWNNHASDDQPTLSLNQVSTGDLINCTSTTAAVKFPAMTTVQKNAIANSAGRVVFDTDLGKLCVNTGAAWQTITSV